MALFLVKTSGLAHVDVEEAASLRDVMAAEQIGKKLFGAHPHAYSMLRHNNLHKYPPNDS